MAQWKNNVNNIYFNIMVLSINIIVLFSVEVVLMFNGQKSTVSLTKEIIYFREKTETEMLPVRKSLRLQNRGPQTAVTLDITPSTDKRSVSHWHASEFKVLMVNFNTILTKHYEIIESEIKQICLISGKNS